MSKTAEDLTSDITEEPTAEAETPEEEEAKKEEEFVPSDADLKLETKKFILLTVLEKAASVLPSRDVMPVLKNFQLEAVPGEIRVVATDLELSVLSTAPMVRVVRPGTAVFPGARFLEIAKQADDGEIVIDVKDGVASIRVGRAEWTLRLQDGSEYPDLPDLDDVEFHTVDRAKFFGALNAVRYAAATDTVRPSLMLIDITERKMRAADGVRFQQVTMPFWPDDLDIQIPINAVEDLTKLLKSTELQTIDIGDTENFLVFRVGGDVFIANKLTVEFPPVDDLLLKPALANDQELHADREELMHAIKRVRVTADEETSAVVLHLEPNKMTVMSKDKLGNMAKEDLDVDWKSADRDVAFNHDHLTQMLEMSDAKSCAFFLGPDAKTRKSPIMLKDDAAAQLGVLNQLRMEHLS